MCIVIKLRISNLWLNALKIERKPNRKILYTKNFKFWFLIKQEL